MEHIFGEEAWPSHLAGIGMGLATASGDGIAFVNEPWIQDSLALALEPSWRVRLAAGASGAKNDPAHDTETIASLQRLVREEAGIIRFVATVLAMLAAAPDVERIAAPFGGHRYAGGRKVPLLGHNTVSIKLPKKKPQRYLVGELYKAARDRRRHRAHEVRGHFRMIERGKLLPRRCDHHPTMVENGVGICLRCERLIRWIAPHNRGDLGLGWIDHDYILERDKR